MTDFLRAFLSRPGAARTVILLEPDLLSAPRQYEVRPGTALVAVGVAIVAVAAVLVAAVVLTPLRGTLLGPDSDELRAAAQRNAARAAALEDSMTVQVEQITVLRALITGEPGGESSAVPETAVPEPDDSSDPDLPPTAKRTAASPLPSASSETMSGTQDLRPGPIAAYLASLRAPAPPPLDGVVSRGFLPARGHYGLDLAADAGTAVGAAADGTVVFGDWTQGGGLTIAVQHAGGYLLVYKHNSRLLRRAGERVQAREAVALSGNTGEITSGPHLHVEVWRDGRPLDPATFFSLR
jgi:murein DD-endopeptidase MepM/ murein hydrolase activator NlpD